MVQSAIVGDLHHAADGSGFRIVGAVDHARDAGVDERAGAHGAGLEGDDQRATQQPPVADAFRGLADGDDLGVRGRVAGDLPEVSPRRYDRAVGVEDHRADRDVSVLCRAIRFGQRQAHCRGPGTIDHARGRYTAVDRNGRSERSRLRPEVRRR